MDYSVETIFHFYLPANRTFFLFSFSNQLLRTQDAGDLVVALATIFSRCVHLMFFGTQHQQEHQQQLLSLVSPDSTHSNEIIYECCRLLRNSCAVDKHLQMQMAQFSLDGHSIFQPINVILMSNGKLSPRTQKMCWQMLANLGVQNEVVQREIWRNCMEPLIGHLQCVCQTGNDRECTMILYNLCISEILNVNDVRRIVEILLECVCNQQEYEHGLANNDFHRLFMEHIITKYRSVVPVFDRIVPHEKRLHLIYYIADHMKTVRHDLISSALLQFICKEFKKKSDCVLRTTASSTIDTIYPKEVVALLDVIAQASSDERYSEVLATDNSLFINVGCLLRSVHDLGKRQTSDTNDENIFAPIQKLTQLAPNSSENTIIERDISYQLKSTLIRTLANLVYKNKKNQDLVSGA